MNKWHACMKVFLSNVIPLFRFNLILLGIFHFIVILIHTLECQKLILVLGFFLFFNKKYVRLSVLK